MMGFSHWQLLLFAVAVFLLFGNRLPGVMRSLGKSVVEFKKGVQGLDEENNEDSEKKSDSKE